MLLNAWTLNAVVLNGGVEDFPVHSGAPGGRYVSDAEIDFLLTAPAITHHARVLIAGPDGVMRDYSTRDNINWIHSLEWEGNIDAPVGTATVKLLREAGNGWSLAPLRTDSSYNLIPYVAADLSAGVGPSVDAGRRIVIYTASVPMGDDPSDTDWRLVFEGFIDKFDWDANPVVLYCRDKGAAIVDTWFPAPNTIVADDNIQTTLTQLLDLLHLDVYTPLYVPVVPDPEVLIGSFNYDVESGMDVLQRIAQIIGWTLGFRYADVFGEFRLTFKDPGRTKTDPDFTITPSSYIKVNSQGLDRTPVRNDIWVSYRPDNDPMTPRALVNAANAESIRRYGRRSMVIQEDDASPINSSDSAQYMADLIAFDLSEVDVDKTVDMPYFWPVELNDLIRFTPNRVHEDADLDIAVVGYKHTLDENQSRTQLMTRGKPAGSYWRWLLRKPTKPVTDPDGSPPGSALFSNLRQEPDYGSDVIVMSFDWSGATFSGPGGFQIFIQYGVTSDFNVGIGLGTSPTSYNFTVPGDLEPFDDPLAGPADTKQISFKLKAYDDDGNLVAESAVSTVTYRVV